MKKNRLYLIIAGVLVLASIFVVLQRNNVFSSKDELGPIGSSFAIKDTNLVTKIFMADMRKNKVLLSRTDSGWLVDDSVPALKANVDNLLSTLQNLVIKQTVAKTAQSNINKMLTTKAIKVEVYQIAPKFKIFGIPFFTKERITKTYYMGEATMDNMGNYALVEGMSEPFVVTIPGFRGFVTPQFSPYPLDWYSHTLFQTKLTRIASVQFIDIENPSESFLIKKEGARFFSLFDVNNQQITHYDTTRVVDMLSEFRERNYLSISTHLTQKEKDAIIQNDLFKIIVLTDIDGNKYELRTYHQMELVQEMQNDIAIGEPKMVSNLDAMYATFNGDLTTIYKLQYHYFDRQLQPLSYFVKK
jgi:hypothetical protein